MLERLINSPKTRPSRRVFWFSGVDFIFIGGSTVSEKEFNQTIAALKKLAKIPIVIFPGSSSQVSPLADAILLLNLISGRNADFALGCLYAD